VRDRFGTVIVEVGAGTGSGMAGSGSSNQHAQARAGRGALGAAAVLAATVALSACGGDKGGRDEQLRGGPALGAAASGYPRPSSRSLRDLIGSMPQGPNLAPSTSLLNTGRNRFGFALFDRGNRQIADLKVAVYTAQGLDEPVRGPYVARFERITVEPPFRSKQYTDDPDAARSVYVANLRFGDPSGYLIVAVAKLGGRWVVSSPTQVAVTDRSGVPGVGDRAIRVHTPTTESVNGKLSTIDTRLPPDSMHEVDLADALHQHRPVLLLFSTPGLCESRVCGPVTDIAEQVKSEMGRRADFIHMEIYRDNDPSKGARPQVRAWHLRREPYAFAVNARGRVAARLDGAFNADELRTAVRKALR
jgi:hypothetical protein